MSSGNRSHCRYCSKPLYKMSLNQRTSAVTSVEVEHGHNSDQEPVCLICADRLVYRGSVIECSNCDQPIFTIRVDKFREDPLTVYDLEGIVPQRDPIEGVVNRCAHCKTTLEWG